MEVYERVNQLLKEKKILKKDFVEKLLSLEPKLKSTDEIPTNKTIYSYLNGTLNLKLELIPYIAEALDITEQALFDNSEKSRLKYLKYILSEPSQKEIEFIKGKLIADKRLDNNLEEIIYLLKYAPIPLLEKLTHELKSFKKISDEF